MKEGWKEDLPLLSSRRALNCIRRDMDSLWREVETKMDSFMVVLAGWARWNYLLNF